MMLLEPESLPNAALDVIAHVCAGGMPPRHQEPEAGLAAFPLPKVEAVAIEVAAHALAQ
jgi:hypothetical protein